MALIPTQIAIYMIDVKIIKHIFSFELQSYSVIFFVFMSYAGNKKNIRLQANKRLYENSSNQVFYYSFNSITFIPN